ncbi:MAG: hypothetical protein P1U86_11755 [Verrucomicrobiales bacterium]|nr:hypothetical protein [Verrucomicrobiales bacterium]
MENPTIEKLSGKRWDDPLYPSEEVCAMHQIRKTPIFDLSPEQLIRAYDQDWYRSALIPAILSALETNPRVKGDALVTKFLEYCESNQIDDVCEERFDSIVSSGAFEELDELDYLQILLFNRDDRRGG